MTEVSFAKQFLTKLDSVAVKLSADNVVDPRTYPAQSAYILPRLPNAKRKRPLGTEDETSAAASSGASAKPGTAASSGGITVQLQPLKSNPRSPPLSLSSQTPQTAVYDLKAAYASANQLDPAKLKLLRNKKPVADSKSLRDLLAEDGDGGAQAASVELGIMLMPGAVLEKKEQQHERAQEPAQAEKMEGVVHGTAPVAQGLSGAQVLQTDGFWNDLRDFLVQRIRDADEGKRLATTFREAWASSR